MGGAAEEAEADWLAPALAAADEDEAAAEDDESATENDEEAADEEADGPSEDDDELVALAGPVGYVTFAAGAETVTLGSVMPDVLHEERKAAAGGRARVVKRRADVPQRRRVTGNGERRGG